MGVSARARILARTETNTPIYTYYKDYLNIFLATGVSDLTLFRSLKKIYYF